MTVPQPKLTDAEARRLILENVILDFGGNIMLAPLDSVGIPDWEAALADELDLPSHPPVDDEAPRLCAVVDAIPGLVGARFVVYLDWRLQPKVRQACGRPGDDQIAYALIVRSIVPEHPTDIPLAAPNAANDNERRLPDPPPMMADPLEPEAAGGLLADVAKWITTTAIIPSPELSMVAASALLAGLFGRKVLTPMRGGINLYATTLLDTAGGKGHPPKAIRALADGMGRMGVVSNGDHTSYAAIERTLRKNTSTVIVMDEFGITLQDVNGRHASSAAASIRKFLLAVYDQANSKFDGRIYASADAKKVDDPIDGPALTVLGMTTIETLFAGLGEASVADGFINRFLFVTSAPAQDVRPPRLDRDGKPPASLIAALQAAYTGVPAGPGTLLPGKYVVPFDGGEDGDAYHRWGQVFLWQRHPAWDATEMGINGRAAENTLRLATIRAISRDHAAPAVTLDDVEWGWAIVHASIALVTDGARRHMAASPAEALRKAIVAALDAAPDKTLPISKMMERHGVRGADMREFRAALEWLINAGQITDLAGRPMPGRGSRLKLLAVLTA